MNRLLSSIRAFAREDEGSQIIEYALIIAVISIALLIGLSPLSGVNMTNFISRVGICLTTNACV
jgi:pilus assembly protein Flp/PilA